MVDVRRFELVTSSVLGKRSLPELNVRVFRVLHFAHAIYKISCLKVDNETGDEKILI